AGHSPGVRGILVARMVSSQGSSLRESVMSTDVCRTEARRRLPRSGLGRAIADLNAIRYLLLWPAQSWGFTMDRRTFIAALLAAQASLWGCDRPKGFNIANRNLSKAELEKHIADVLKLHEVTLTDQGGGRFTGTGKNAEGNVVNLELTQEE